MIWKITSLYFTFYSIFLLGGVIIYAKILLLFSRKRGVFKFSIIYLIAFLFIGVFIAFPIFLFLYIINNIDSEALSKNSFYWYFVVCYALSIIPGIIIFYKKYLKDLKKLGY